MRRLVLAGFQDSGPLHWQTLWARGDPRYIKLAHASWDAPDRHDWLRELEAVLPAVGPDTVIVAHSLGCILTAFWAATDADARVRGAFLVAPPDLGRPDAPRDITNFLDVPRIPLPFPTLVVGSDDDPYGSATHMAGLARDWSARFVLMPGLGHIGSMSGVGRWPAGKALLEEFIASLV
ncbi:MAG: hypothetical protein RLZZ200_1100 [Pseudomonadota bacterium]